MEERLVTLVRHGQEEGAGGGRRFVGQIDPPLAPEGRDQARRLARRLAGAPLAAVVTSDLRRARETAAELGAGRPGLPIVERADLRELALGAWDGRSFREVAAEDPGAFAARGADLAGFRPPGGESFDDLAARAVAAFHDVLGSTRGPLLLVAHAGVNRVILCHVLGMPVANVLRVRQDHGCLNVLRQHAGGFEVRLING